MAEETKKTIEADLLEIIREIESGGRVSTKRSEVSNLIKSFESYRKTHKEAKKKPDDYGDVGKSLTELKKAQKVFDTDAGAIYSTTKAKGAEKKVDTWIRANSNNPQGILKALDFRLEVEKAAKKAKNTSNSSKGSTGGAGGADPEYNESVLAKTVAALEGIAWPADKDKITEYLKGKEKQLDKAISGAWANFKKAANNSNCKNVNLDGDSKRNYIVTN